MWDTVSTTKIEMRFLKQSFSQRLIVSFLAVFIIILLALGVFISRRLSREVVDDLTSSLLTQTKIATHLVESWLLEEMPPEKIHARFRQFGPSFGARMTLIRPDGVVIADSHRRPEELLQMDNHRKRPEIDRAFEALEGTSIRYSSTLQKEMLYTALPLRQSKRIIGVLRMALELDHVEIVLQAVQKPIQIGILFGIFWVLVLGALLGRYLTRRIHQLKDAALRYRQGDFDLQVRMDSQDELRILADAMNQMAGSLKERIQDIETEKAKVATILENMTEGVIAVDKKKHVIIVNTGAEKIFGLSKRQMLGTSLIETVRNYALDQMMERVLWSAKIVTEEIELAHPEDKVLRANAVGVQESQGDLAAVLVVYDITPIRRLERIRREFVANASHELKTPLTSLKGFIETLLGGAFKDEKRSESFLKMMESDAERLSRLIEDLLQLSKIESKEIALQKQNLNLKNELDPILEKFRPRLDEKNIRIEYQIRQTQILADQDQLEQVLVNLLDNAIKFSPEGGLIRIGTESSDAQVRISVQDEGIGIPSRDIPRIFERFYRVDKARSRELGGTGLGLSIVKHIVERHGGEVLCESELGKGSKFIFTLEAAS